MSEAGCQRAVPEELETGSEERRAAGYVLVGEIKPITWKTRDVGCETKEATRFK